MNTRISMLAATAAIATMPLLAACGSSAEPQSPPASAASPVASPAAPSTVAPSTSPATEAAATPSSDPTPTSEPSQDTGEVKAAAEKWVKSALTLGYPDTSSDDYLDRLEPLMTKSAFAEVEKSAKASKKLESGIKTLAKNRGRSTPKFSDSKVSSVTSNKATTKLTYQLLTQQQTGGKWTTLRTAAKDTVTVQLVDQGGKWLVEDAT